MTSTMERVAKARTGLIMSQPFFGSLSLRLELIEDNEATQTACTNGIFIKFNTLFVAELSILELQAVICHEVLHVACGHHLRRGDRDHVNWNIACDHAINGFVPFPLPKGYLKPINDSAENIYSRIHHKNKEEQQDKGEKGNQGDKCGEVIDHPGNEAEKNQAMGELKVAVAQALQQNKNRIPKELKEIMEDFVNPKLDWKEILYRFIQQTAKNDYSWTHPNRRFVHQGLYLPSAISNELTNIVISFDVSGSVYSVKEKLNQFSSEISAILSSFSNVVVTVIYCSDEIKGVETYTTQDLPIKLTLNGGGNTDFNPPFDYLENENIRPACMLYLTDLESRRFPKDPGYPVLWVYYGEYGTNPPFGEVIKI